MVDQLIKKDSQNGYRNVFPKTFLDAIKDRESGKSLIDILNSFNMYFVPYAGDEGQTRVQVPKVLRRRGIWLTYVLWDTTIIVEFYNGDSIEDDEFRKNSNWIKGYNRLVGDIMISSEGNWIINGVDSGLTAKGDTGIAPLIRVADNKLQVSYDEGDTWELLNDSIIITKFRVNDNRLEVSYDLGISWSVCSEYIASWFRVNNNKLEISRDEQNTWEEISDYLAVYIKSENNKLWISRDKDTWEEASDFISTYFRIENNKLQSSVDNQNWEDISDYIATYFKVEGNKLWISKDNINWEEASDYIATYFRIENNKLQSSIDKENWEDISDFIAAYFRVEGNKLQISRDKVNWTTVSDYIATYFRQEGNKLQMSNDQENWEDCSDYIAAWFRWSSNNRIQISRTNTDGSWQDLSPTFTDNVYIRGYLSSIDEAPSDSPIGAIYMVGPNSDHHYEMFIKTSDGWMDNGAFTSFQAGIVQDLSSNSENAVPSVKAVNHYINGLILTPITVSEFDNLQDSDKDNNKLYLCIEDE